MLENRVFGQAGGGYTEGSTYYADYSERRAA